MHGHKHRKLPMLQLRHVFPPNGCLCKCYLVQGFRPGTQHQGKTCMSLPTSRCHSSVTFVFPAYRVSLSSLLLYCCRPTPEFPAVSAFRPDHTSECLRLAHDILECRFSWLLTPRLTSPERSARAGQQHGHKVAAT